MSRQIFVTFPRKQGFRKPVFGIGLFAIVIFLVCTLAFENVLVQSESSNLVQYQSLGKYNSVFE